MKKILLLLITGCMPLHAINYTVKAGGGGSFTTMGACASQMTTNGTASSDTCTVFAGTYNENVTIPAGSVGNYKIFNVNGTDIVTVTSVTMSSHTQLNGNCTAPAAVSTCGFTFSPASAANCINFGSSATDFFVRNNTLQTCNRLNPGTGTSFYYIQGNTFAWSSCVPPTPGQVCGQWIADWGNNSLVEGNDFSHYQLGANIQGIKHIWRNNTFHDQNETEAGSNHHTDIIFMEPNITTGQLVLEGNFERNAVGPNAKGILTQNDACSPGPCTFSSVIERFNTASSIGAAYITNDKSWSNIKAYNNTFVDEGFSASQQFGGDNMLSSGSGMAVLNSIWYQGPSGASSGISSWNPYACTGCANFGHNLYYCNPACSLVANHTYGNYGSGPGTFASDPGNLAATNPLFVSYVSAGSTSNNYHLQNGSPAIAAGTFLTTVNGTISNSTALVVSDATYFQDGYGLSNPFSTVTGDCVSVTTVGNHICVTAVNYGTNTLTLASPISATNGDSVWLYSKSDGVQVLTGTAPDMGAFPFATGSYTITISSITGHGTVTSSDSIINCTTGTTGTCADSSALGTITLTATPSAGYLFGGWGGSCAGTSTCSVSTTATVTATFTVIPSTGGQGFAISNGAIN